MSVSQGGGRGGGVAFLQVLLAMLFLAIIGGTVGYLLGEQHNHRIRTAGGGASPGATGPSASGSGGGTATGGASAAPVRCPGHTEDLAGSRLTQVLYLKTTKGSQVWICKSADGTLYYQGHVGTDPKFREGDNSLYLTDVSYEGGEYVARNYDPNNESTTEYHVTSQRLVQVFRNYPSPRPNSTEPAA